MLTTEISSGKARTSVTFDDWTAGRSVESLGTNFGSKRIAFQDWHSFKEAFAPELVQRAVKEVGVPSSGACLDPFGGSGTTSLACQFLGISSTTVEVNPFLADVIRAKTSRYDADDLARSLGRLLRISEEVADALPLNESLPPTFVEPGVRGRWLYSSLVARRIEALRAGIAAIESESHQTLFRAILGGVLVPTSNARVNGKGRRYRSNWPLHQSTPVDIDTLFISNARRAILDIHRFRARPTPTASVITGDSRRIEFEKLHDLAVFSPPYPNSFDYTDVYNIELWMLGYLSSRKDNSSLRSATLTSHVQLHRDFAPAPVGSESLSNAIDKLHQRREELWSPWIPSMIGAYFADMMEVINNVNRSLANGGQCWMVVGDSRYAGVQIPSAQIFKDLMVRQEWAIQRSEPFRSMRSSAQQGGKEELPETLLVFSKSQRWEDSHLDAMSDSRNSLSEE